jgi:hypothetical protein
VDPCPPRNPHQTERNDEGDQDHERAANDDYPRILATIRLMHSRPRDPPVAIPVAVD